MATIREIYEQYRIPPNLQRHMLTVAAVCEYLMDNWSGPAYERALTLQAALLHDMGNIIKFKRPFLGEMEQDATYWEQVQAEYVEKYGLKVHQATCAIVTELGLGEKLVPIFNEMKDLLDGKTTPMRWETRILEYADCVVAPAGVVGFEARMDDFNARYGEHDREWEQPFRNNAALVQENVAVDLAEIAGVDFDEKIKALENYEP